MALCAGYMQRLGGGKGKAERYLLILAVCPLGTEDRCVEYAIPGTGFPSTSLSVIVSGRPSDTGATLCVTYAIQRVGLPLNISVSILQRETFGSRVIVVRDRFASVVNEKGVILCEASFTRNGTPYRPCRNDGIFEIQKQFQRSILETFFSIQYPNQLGRLLSQPMRLSFPSPASLHFR